MYICIERLFTSHATHIGMVVMARSSANRAKHRPQAWVKKPVPPARDADHRRFAMKERKFDGIFVGRQEGESLLYAGKVDRGFDTATAKDLQARLKPLIRKTQPYTKRIAYKGIWVEPEFLAEIEYRAKSAEGKVRHPVFKGIREDL
jgi:bifunctional non-homologous end joining protein LigD